MIGGGSRNQLSIGIHVSQLGEGAHPNPPRVISSPIPLVDEVEAHAFDTNLQALDTPQPGEEEDRADDKEEGELKPEPGLS